VDGLSDFEIPKQEADDTTAALDHECGAASNGAKLRPRRHARRSDHERLLQDPPWRGPPSDRARFEFGISEFGRPSSASVKIEEFRALLCKRDRASMPGLISGALIIS
jgi:hypothetical protein